jgi:phospholipid/cholesterol/gamma-HCH transport system substrate-binding protein
MSRVSAHPAAKVAALLVALAAVAALLVHLLEPDDRRSAIAYFPAAVHLYPGSDVVVLGVKVGSVRSVTPQGTRVRVVLEYDATRKLPVDVAAMVGEPTLVADRVVELSPPYDGGPALPDGGTIPLERTRVPLELDQLTASLVDLSKALGPRCANREGALARALEVGAANLRGQGEAAHVTVTRLSELMDTLGDNRTALFSTVRNLQRFTSALAAHDQETRSFTTDLAGVARQLDEQSGAVSLALHELGAALADVSGFVRKHRDALAEDVEGLARVTEVLARERVLLARIIDMGAVGISNYPHMYTPSARTYNARFANVYTDNPALFVCQFYASVGGDAHECLDNLKPLNDLPLPKAAAR